METSVQSQMYIFIVTLVGGMFIALIYDFYRLFRYYSKPKKFKTYVEDLIFWLLLSIMIVLFVNRVNEGEFRAFIFLGFTLGIILYSRLLSKRIIKSISYIINFFIAKIKKFFRFIFGPLYELKIQLVKRLKDIRKYFDLPKIFYRNTIKSIKTLAKKK